MQIAIDVSDGPFRRGRIFMVVMTLTANFAAGLNLFSVSPLLPQAIDEYGISRAEAGLLISMPMLVGAILGIPGGMLAARIGIKRAFMISWVSMGLLSLSAITPNFYVLLVLRLSYGIGLALMVAANGPLVMQWFRGRQVLLINAGNTAILSMGVAASVAGAVPLAEILGWKTTLTVFAGVGVLGAIIWPLAPRDLSRDASRRAGISIRDVIGVLRGRTVALLLVGDVGAIAQYTALTGWLPTFFNEIRNFALNEAGFLTSILPFAGVFAVFAGGALPIRFSFRSILVFSGILVILGGFGSFLATDTVGIYVFVVVLGVGSWLYVPSLLTIPMRLPGATPEQVTIVWGSIMTFAGLGMFISPILVGALLDITGSFLPGFIFCAAGSCSLLIGSLFLHRDVGSQGADS